MDDAVLFELAIIRKRIYHKELQVIGNIILNFLLSSTIERERESRRNFPTH